MEIFSDFKKDITSRFGPITSFEEFVSVSGTLISKSGLRQSTSGLWWRGQSDAGWPLLPSIYRGSINYELEREVVRDFQLKSLPFIQGHRPGRDIEWLFLMQHHGAPTRILDWSESPLVALYFAILDFDYDADAAVWVLHPWILNRITQGQQSIPTARADIIDDYIVNITDPNVPRAPRAELPIAIRIEYGFNRAHNQRGACTVHGNKIIPLDLAKLERHKSAVSKTSQNKLVQKILIDKKSKFAILKSLYEFGMGADTLFPDLDGLSTSLKFRYNYRYLGEKPPSRTR